ncbi:MAG: RelA/SpoT family protein [Patescibacteria group bacterium]|nr:RelA/SpoT family protein [Patescibacteria group bacterium]
MTIKELAQKSPLIKKAYEFSERMHSGQKRKSGEPYFSHPLAAAQSVLDWHLDEATIAAALLHDVIEDTEATKEKVLAEFGPEITFLVEGVTKLGKIKYRGIEAKAENLRKMILSLSEDLRVIFIKLADRLHNMKTLSALPPQKQKRIALETAEIYAPLAYRLGMQNLSGELEDLAFPYIHPKEYDWLKNHIKEEFSKREDYLLKIKPAIEKALSERNISPLMIDFRAKRYSSLYKKLLRYDMDIEKIYDLIAFRIIVSNVEECYATLGIIHQFWPPLPGRIKDYIAMPKPNGYRSLHTTVIGPEEKRIEFQIRTKQMHEEDENGIAAHWIYEQNKGSSGYAERKSVKAKTEDVLWVKQLRSWQEKYQDLGDNSEEFLQSMKIDFFKDRIFVISPKGDVYDLPSGATPIDFAYQVHSDIGNTCVGAKVNQQIVPLNFELRSGDVVEILSQKNKKPSEDWLEFVKTSIARDRIKSALKNNSQKSILKTSSFKTEIKVVVKDRIGIFKEIASVINRSHINIVGINTVNQPTGQFIINKIICDTTDKNKIENIILKIKKIKEVKEVSSRKI